MSETKRYYWLKLSENFFEDDTISYIETLPNGIAYSNFYLKLCLKSLRSDGKLTRFVGELIIPYDYPSLAKLTGVPIDVVKTAMEVFEKIGLVRKLETGELYLSQIDELIGKETDKAKYMRERRLKEKLEGNNVTQMLPECSPRDKSIEYRDKSIDKEIYKEKNNTDDKSSSHKRSNENSKKISHFIEAYHETCVALPKVRELSDSRKKKILKLLEAFSMDDMYEAFRKVQESDFLTGREGNWRASFDWLLKKDNIVKVLEGNYTNTGSWKKTKKNAMANDCVEYGNDPELEQF